MSDNEVPVVKFILNSTEAEDTVMVNFKAPRRLREEFKKKCSKEFTKPSDLLREYMLHFVRGI